jgi:hypothetical protein
MKPSKKIQLLKKKKKQKNGILGRKKRVYLTGFMMLKRLANSERRSRCNTGGGRNKNW